ncbi:MAG: type II toxin-antitoxin system RelE/ParE family toxin [Bacteroidetes bacterium]|nr:type II toxin-antitoxin system RelE/ParE family toxin [Bacteroidota bacterium]MBS1944916.1 type II toxin-antitoxin system RelE/ParE family toxin [Bacteroidota bacterium]
MKYRLDIAPRVNQEVATIYLYREKKQGKGSGVRFLNALNECYDLILANPYGCQIRKDPFRHVMLDRMKYRLVYKVEGQLVSVVQVRHTSRKVSKKFGP